MIAYILRSLAQGALVLLAVAFIAFSMFRFVGDPVANMVGQEATLEDREQLRERLGLDRPFPIQYAIFVGNAVQGDFGISYRQARPVSALMLERLPATLELALLSALFLGEAVLEWRNLAALVMVCGGIWLVTTEAQAPRPVSSST